MTNQLQISFDSLVDFSTGISPDVMAEVSPAVSCGEEDQCNNYHQEIHKTRLS